jgi:pimeloyl-ACP methyl ester carboxylesterase
MASHNGPGSGERCHIVLVPGFGGFDTLGQVEYYAGITGPFRKWQERRRPTPVVLHYFDNLPTAAVSTRATRLRMYLAKRIARGEILETDKIVLVGHSTGGLDIRQLICDLHQRRDQGTYVDGGASVKDWTIRRCLDAVVFLSVPHWGTNIADWVRSHSVLRKAAIRSLRGAVEGSQCYLLDEIESNIAGGTAGFTGAELFLAAKDALREANEHYGNPGPLRTAEAQEAASELGLYFCYMVSDFSVINDLTSAQPDDPAKRSPAHWETGERKEEFGRWDDPHIDTLSYATVGGRPFPFIPGCPAPVWELTSPCTFLEIATGLGVSAHTDFLYRFCYRACAGGPFQRPAQAGQVKSILGPSPPQPIERWDNDGIVNTLSMPWPRGETVLVLADHLDVVGHYKLAKARQEKRPLLGREPGRIYQSYDAFKSVPRFTRSTFEALWTEIFEFATDREAFPKRRKSQPRTVKLADSAVTGC